MCIAYYYRTNWLLSANLKDNLQERTNEGNAEPVVNADGVRSGTTPLLPLVSDRAPCPYCPLFLNIPGKLSSPLGAGALPMTQGVEEWSLCLWVGQLGVLFMLQSSLCKG